MKPRVRFGVFIAGALVVAAALAFFVSPFASSQPDGLNKVAIDKGFDATEEDHALGDLPTAGYSVRGIDDDSLSRGVAGLIGVAATAGIAGGATYLLRRSQPKRATVQAS